MEIHRTLFNRVAASFCRIIGLDVYKRQILTFFAPKMFVGIAFDSGGVASGPLTVTFMLAFCQGIASGTGGAATLIDGFGMITMAALMPLITLQLLGVVYKIKLKKNPSREE